MPNDSVPMNLSQTKINYEMTKCLFQLHYVGHFDELLAFVACKPISIGDQSLFQTECLALLNIVDLLLLLQILIHWRSNDEIASRVRHGISR